MNDGEQYTSLLLRHRKLIWFLCYRYARRDADRCKDLVQEVSIALWEYYGRRKPGTRPLDEVRWVSRNTNTLLRNMHRGPQHDMLPLADWMADSIADPGDNGRDLLEELMEALPDSDRRLLQMRLDGYSADEIGKAMHLSRDAVYQRIKRIIDKLKQISHER